jgi:hypothetical protein
MSSDGTSPPRPRVARSGPIALLASVVLVVWVAAGVWLALLAGGNSVAGVIAYVMFFASWLVVPALIVVIIVFAILALLFNPVPGKIMGALSIVLPVALALWSWNAIGGFSEQFLGAA